MRLTLRTLLSYLDDTLEPSQAKIIGAKAAESDQARELMDRIKQVTRRRRLTTPPTTGPGGIDPNTIAEYLDNEVTPEKAAEVEQICLASDVHLAEVAACHQILTLVLGEPAMVSSSAKQRMYALVKGPEAIQSRKPIKATSKTDLDLSSEIEIDPDDTLSIGVPTSGGKYKYGNPWILIGGGALAACLLIVAVWQLVRDPGDNRIRLVSSDAKKITVPQPDEQVKDKDEKGKDGAKTDAVVTKPPDGDVKKENGTTEKTPPKIKIDIVPVEVEPAPAPVEIPFKAASLKQLPIGKVLPPGKEGQAIVQMKPDKSGWMRVTGKGGTVSSARPLMSLPGSKTSILLDSGPELLLWGNLFEVTYDPFMAESRVTLHAPEQVQVDADLTLQRGRVIIANNKDKAEIRVRVRFDNPTLNEENHIDMVLEGKAVVALERDCRLDQDEPFFENPKDPARIGPTATVMVYSISRGAKVQFGTDSYAIDKDRPALRWASQQGLLKPASEGLPFWIKGTAPPGFDTDDARQRQKYAIKAHEALASLLETKVVDVALAELTEAAQQASQKDLMTTKRLSLETLALWNHVIRCSAAVDNIGFLFDEFSQETTIPVVRGMSQSALQTWIGLSRDHDYQLLDVVRKNYRNKTASIKIVELFHMISREDVRKPITYQRLIEGLNNDLSPIRILSYWHLFVLVPAGQSIPYDPAAPRQVREDAVRAWAQLIPAGQLPPMGPPPKKGKQ